MTQKKVNLKTWLETQNKEDESNKVTSISSSSTDEEYPSAKAVFDELELKQDAADAFSGDYDDLTNKPTIPTATSELTNDGDGSNPFLTTHQDISGKEDKSNKVTSLSSASTDTQYPSAKVVYDELDLKQDKADAFSGDYEDLTNKPTIPTVVDTIADSNMNAVTSNAVHDGLALKANTGHTHSASEVLDSTAHTNLETAANATQAAINSAIDTKIGSLLSIELITIVDSLPTASASTMNKMYLVAESSSKTQDNYEIFITVRSGSAGSYTYAWEKVDTARIDLSGYVRKADVALEIVNDELILTLD